MLVIENLLQVANQIESERGVSKDVLFEAIEQSLESACRKKHPEIDDFKAELDRESGEVQMFQQKIVVEDLIDDNNQILEKDAKKIDKSAELDDVVNIAIDIPNFGRIAAQVAKQIILQRVREAEKQSVLDEFSKKIGKIITGKVQRQENRNYLINLGRTEAILDFRDQIQGEILDIKQEVKIFLVDIIKENKGYRLHISRSHPGFLNALLENEVPEIRDGIIEIKATSRQPGERAKVAVKSNEDSIGAIGTCVGQHGSRIQTIIKELNNEKIDILNWNENIQLFIANALKPAEISSVIIKDEDEREAQVIVPDDQLSLAIGKRGVNVRLSAQLTGWKLDIIGETAFNEEHGPESVSLLEKIQQHNTTTDKSASESNSGGESLADKIKKSQDEALEEAPVFEPTLDPDLDTTPSVSELADMLGIPADELISKASENKIEITEDSELSKDQIDQIKEILK